MAIRYTPFDDIDRMFDQMRKSFSNWDVTGPEYSGGFGRTRSDVHLDLTERDDEFVLMADLPGFEKEEISLRYEDGMLFIEADHEVTDEGFSRSRTVREQVRLPKDVVEEEIEAHYRNGVLEVHLPLVEDATERGHEIDISD